MFDESEWLKGYHQALKDAEQMARNQCSDEIPPGDWNEACRHIAICIKEMKAKGL